jgi:hypothetical protein
MIALACSFIVASVRFPYHWHIAGLGHAHRMLKKDASFVKTKLLRPIMLLFLMEIAHGLCR